MTRSINWFPWCQDTFVKSSDENKPILMYLTARWCGWCAVMEDTTYQDPQVIDLVEENYIPMKVNVDQYPHVADRYHFGGYPSVVFLSSDGQILQGENYLSGDQMKSVLEEVLKKSNRQSSMVRRLKSESYGNGKNKLKQKSSEQTNVVLPSICEINKIIANSFDQKYGGFFIYSPDTKFPFPEIHDYLFSYVQFNSACPEEEMLKTTLDAMLKGELYDHSLGGFFRFCENRDWTLPHSEKLLDNNAALARNYLTALDKFGLEEYRVAARDTINYLVFDFFDQETQVFAGSRIGKEIDATPYTNWNSTAISSLLIAYQVLDHRFYLETALKVIESLWARCYRLGRGMSHFYLNGPSEVELLSDQIKYISALYDAYLCTEGKTYLHRARLLMRHMEKNYRMPEGNFSDIPVSEKRPGYLSIPLVPFMENVDVALLFIKFARLFGSGAYIQKAEEILRSLSGMIMDNPIFAAKYGQGLLEMEHYRVKNQSFS
ncbi:MAG: DUF255 domain-containing protein [Dehalobacterium sp.]